jgi:hypothetical protein
MLLMNVVQDDTMAVPGFEHRTFMCSDCHDVERRLVFTRPVEPSGAEAVPVHAAPPIAPASAVENEHTTNEHTVAVEPERAASPGILMRVFAMLRGAETRRS